MLHKRKQVSMAFRKPLLVRLVWVFALLQFQPISLVFAQTSVDKEVARELQRQNEQLRVLREQQEKKPDVYTPGSAAIASTELPESEVPCFTIREIVFDGDEPFPWIDAEISPFVGRCLGGAGIRMLMARIQNAIVARGYITTRVLAPEQDLNEGILKLVIVPGRIRSIRQSPETDKRANFWNALPAAPGDLLYLRDIEHGLENLRRVPTVEAEVEIVPGEIPGESDLLITWEQRFPLRLALSVSDGGSKSTGKYLGSLTFSGDHLLTLNDLFYASYSHDLMGSHGKGGGEGGTKGYTVHYSLPWNYWLFGVTGSENRYHQNVAGDSQNYLYHGLSENYEARLTRILYRGAQSRSSASLRAYLVKSANFLNDTEIETQRRRMAGWELGLQHRAFIADAIVDLAISWRQGTGAFKALVAPEEAFDDGTHRPRIISADANVNIPFRLAGESVRYSASWRAQWNRTPLVPLDRFSIGGRYTVRGFDGESILMAERGWFVRNDLGWRLRQGQELYLGFDHGRVGGQSADLLVGRKLAGGVIGWRGAYRNLSWDLFSGWPLSKPEEFKTAHRTSGFVLNWSW